MAQQLMSLISIHEGAVSIPGLAQGAKGSSAAVSCGVGCRCGSDPVARILCCCGCRPAAATALIRPLAWEPPCAAEQPKKWQKDKTKDQKKKKEKEKKKKRAASSILKMK